MSSLSKYILGGSDKMIIRLAKLEDVKTISEMYRDFFAFNAEMQPAYYKKAESGEYPLNTIKSEDSDIIIAQTDEITVGFLSIFEEKTPPYDSLAPHKFAVVMDLFVLPSYRKKGIGTALIDVAKRWADKRNLDYLELNILSENENAARFYMREGFKTVSHTLRFLSPPIA